MPYLLALAWVLCAALAAWLLNRAHRKQARQCELLRRLRSSGMYAGIYALFRSCEGRYVERMILRSEEVSVVFLQPEGDTVHYVFDEHGVDPLNEEMLHALAQAAAIDVPCLRDSLYYRYDVQTLTSPAGVKQRWYTFTIRQKRKDYLLHAIRAKNRQFTH